MPLSVARSLRRFSALLFASMRGSVIEIDMRSLLTRSEGAAMRLPTSWRANTWTLWGW